jgi:hypothetical protein
MNALIAGMKFGRKERTVCQKATEVNPEKMESNREENEAVAERQEIPNEDVGIHSLRDEEKRRWPAKKRQRHGTGTGI